MVSTESTPSRRGGWSRLWEPLWRLVLVVVLGFATFALTWSEIESSLAAAGRSLDEKAGLLVFDLLLGVVAIGLYTFRRRSPLLCVSSLVAVSALSSLAAPAAAFGIVSLSTRRRRAEITIVSCLFLASVLVNTLTFSPPDSPPWWEVMLFAAVSCAVLVLIGLYIGGRRQLLKVLQERAEQAEREHEAGIERARSAERARIAREMHDTLAHRLSLLALHAGALEYRTDLSPEQVRGSAGTVRENAHLAAIELREVLGVLRGSDGKEAMEVVRPPESALEALESLLRDSREAGSPAVLTVEDTVAGELDTLPTAIARHLRRVIQEGLTNARKHAPGVPVHVRVGGSPGQRLAVSVANPLLGAPPVSSAPDSGFGLMGLQERVRIAGGELTAVQVDGAFALQAWFPWTT